MVMSIQALPFEVLLQIFQNLPTHSLLNCATVCKAWYLPSVRVIYENIEFTNSATRKLEFYENQDEGVNVGTLARSLKIGLGYNQLNQEQFLKLLSYMPYLKVIEMDAHVYQLSRYFDYLLKRGGNRMQNLEYLNFDHRLASSSDMEKYFLLAYSLRNTLKNLHLCSLRNKYAIGGTSDNQQNDKKNAVDLLNDFPKLTLLTIKNQYGRTAKRLSIFRIIRSCPNLTSFDFKSEHPIPEDDETSTFIGAANNGVTSSNDLPSSSKTIAMVKPKLRKLQDFALRLPNMTEPQMQHVLSSLPTTTMNSFKLELNDTASGLWIQDLQETSLEKLGKYLGNVRQKSEFSITCYNRIPDILENEILASIDITAKFLPLISTIMAYRKPPYCHIQIRISDLIRDRKLSTPVVIKKNDRYLFFSYVLDSAEYETRLFQSEIPDELPLLQAVVPLTNNSNSKEASFNETTITSMEIVLEDKHMKHSRFLEILESAINNCLLLKCISFTKGSHRYKLKFGCSPEICDTRSRSGHDTGFRFSSYYGNNPDNATGTSKENLQYMLLSHARLRQSACTLLANLLPLTKVMKLTHCEIEKDESNNATVDIRGMEHLQQLVLDVGFVAKKRRYVFIMVQMENNQVSCFKADGGPRFAPIFEPVAVKYAYAYNRFESVYSSTIIIKCRKIDEIGVSLHGDDIQTLIKPHLNSVEYP